MVDKRPEREPSAAELHRQAALAKQAGDPAWELVWLQALAAEYVEVHQRRSA